MIARTPLGLPIGLYEVDVAALQSLQIMQQPMSLCWLQRLRIF